LPTYPIHQELDNSRWSGLHLAATLTLNFEKGCGHARKIAHLPPLRRPPDAAPHLTARLSALPGLRR